MAVWAIGDVQGCHDELVRLIEKIRFDPASEKFERFAMPRAGANIRQIHGRPGEVWLPESGTEHISVIRNV